MELSEVLRALQGLPSKELAAVQSKALAFIQQTEGAALRWIPNPGPQTEAYDSEADETLFGGEPGGGKSQLLIGLALNKHERSLLLRRTAKEASKFVGEIEAIVGSRDNFSGKDDQWRLPDGRLVDHGGCQHEDDKQKYKGDPHDLIGFDELTDFTESQYMFIKQWNRSTKKGQRCRTVASSNGPSDVGGLWVVKRWAAWLDPTHPNPAESGEIRWYITNESGDEEEVPGPITRTIFGREVRAMSRTFIRSRLIDNPDLAETNYGSALMNQTAENRKAYALGDFTAGLEDDPNQAIPTAWVQMAMERWQPVPPVGVPMCTLASDVAQGGPDRTTIARRYDGWYARIIDKPGKETPTGTEVAAFVLANRRNNAHIVIDVGGGHGAEAYGHLRGNGLGTDVVTAYMGIKPSGKREVNGQFTFSNIRTEAYWRFREALNPDIPGGSPIALPDDKILVADLCAPRYEIKAGKGGMVCHLEPKPAVCDRLGRSTDKGDAVVMAWYAGARMSTSWHQWPASKGMHHQQPTVKISRRPLTRR